VGLQNFKAVLFFAIGGSLVGKELGQEGVLIDRGVGRLRVLEDDGDAVIPALLLGHVESGGVHAHRQDAALRHLGLQHRVVIFLEEFEELLLVPPVGFVVVLHDVRFAGIGRGRRLRTGQGGK
jgi:hypothetical protein